MERVISLGIAHERAIPIEIYRAEDLRVVRGVCYGAGLTPARDLTSGDTYSLARARRRELLAVPAPNGGHVAAGSAAGCAGNRLRRDATLTFLDQTNAPVQAALIVETETATGRVAGLWVAFATDPAGRELSLVTIEAAGPDLPQRPRNGLQLVADTPVHLADGRQVPARDLAPGDRLAGGDDAGPVVTAVMQDMRRGDRELVVCAAGAFGNAHTVTLPADLMVRLCAAEATANAFPATVPAAALVNGGTVTRDTGGWVEYVTLALAGGDVIASDGMFLMVDAAPAPRPLNSGRRIA